MYSTDVKYITNDHMDQCFHDCYVQWDGRWEDFT